MLIQAHMLRRPVTVLPDGDPGPPPPNTPPVVTITSPIALTATDIQLISFACTAIDGEDGPLSGGSVVWTSSLDGQIGTGTAFSSTLSVGSHTITCVATDWGGLTGTDTVSLTVSVYSPPSAEYARRFFEHAGVTKDLYPGGNPSTFEGAAVAELPEFFDTTWDPPAAEDVHYATVGNGATILTAMTAAISAAGSENKPQWVVLPDGDYPYPGAMTVPENDSGEVIYVVSGSVFADTFPKAPGQRVSAADKTSMARIRCTVAQNASILRITSGADWRFTGIWFEKDRDITGFHVGYVDTDRSTSNITFDRCVIHGYYFTTQGEVRGNGPRGFTVLGSYQAVIDSATYQLGAAGGGGSDRGSISVYAGTGPYKIVNNFLSSGGINMLVGGAVGVNLEKDFEIRLNHFHKDPTTDPDTGAPYSGFRAAQKNLFEIKRGTHFLLEGNIFENSWTDGQTGGALLLKATTENSADQGGDGINESGHITIRYNRVLKANTPLASNCIEIKSGGGGFNPGKPLHHVHVHDNLFECRGWGPPTNGSQHSWSMNTDPDTASYEDFDRYVFNRNAWYVSAASGSEKTQQQMRFGGRSTPADGDAPWVVKDNIFAPAHYGVDRLQTALPDMLAEHEAGYRGWRVEGNVVWRTTWMRPAEWVKGGNTSQADESLYFDHLDDYGIPNRAAGIYGPPVPGSRLANLMSTHGPKGPDWDLVEAYTAYTTTGIWPA